MDWRELDDIMSKESGWATLREAGDALCAAASQFLDTGRGDLDGAIERWRALAAVSPPGEEAAGGPGE